MLTYDPSKRITAKEALKHPWFESAGSADIFEKVRDNLSARDKLKKAINKIQGFNRMRKNLNSTTSLISDNADDEDEDEDEDETITTTTTTTAATITITKHQKQNRKVEEGNEVGKELKEENNDIDVDVKVENVSNVSKVTAEVS